MHAHMHCTARPIARGWEPDYLVRWLFDQTDIWVTAQGVVVEVESMDPEHALNTLCFLERVADDFPFGRDLLQSKPLYEALRKRVLDILVPPQPEPAPQFVVDRAPRWEHGSDARYAVYKMLADGSPFEWDAPFMSRADAEAKAAERNAGLGGV